MHMPDPLLPSPPSPLFPRAVAPVRQEWRGLLRGCFRHRRRGVRKKRNTGEGRRWGAHETIRQGGAIAEKAPAVRVGSVYVPWWLLYCVCVGLARLCSLAVLYVRMVEE